jgi:hypothetical protein
MAAIIRGGLFGNLSRGLFGGRNRFYAEIALCRSALSLPRLVAIECGSHS